MAAYNAKLRVWRGDPSGGDLQDYTVEVNDGEVVLDIVHRLQATQAGDLAVRWNCKAGKCGSCSAEINGRPRLLCMTRMSTFDENETVTITPLRTFPVMRDLVTDVSFNYARRRARSRRSPSPSTCCSAGVEQPGLEVALGIVVSPNPDRVDRFPAALPRTLTPAY